MGPDLGGPSDMEKANYAFRIDCKKMGFSPFGDGPTKDFPYGFGLILNWPEKQGDDLKAEAKSVIDGAEKIARKFGVSSACYGLALTVGGGMGMYVKFGEKGELKQGEILYPDVKIDYAPLPESKPKGLVSRLLGW